MLIRPTRIFKVIHPLSTPPLSANIGSIKRVSLLREDDMGTMRLCDRPHYPQLRRQLHVHRSAVHPAATPGLLPVPHLHPDLPDRHHVLDLLLDPLGRRARQGHPVRHLPAHPGHPARAVPEVPAPVSYIKAIDIFMSTCTLFVFSSLMEYAVVNIVIGQAEERERLANMLLSDVQMIRIDSETRVPNGTRKIRSPSLRRGSESLERRALKIDKFSRVVFPLLFIVLNIAYWCYYLT
ncbi:glycine receptor subunit alpha-2 [Caerostris extrusa]|uniref:Glycine receptor subunit alpha-2 n=1 Tax=Caerostris extrusa TaxID=172846 RepID=A0AAV4TSI4_CAEEX|nr:glycine receptor subunit alpha-2 [Caerostris extrusa]